jgi:hypothetical protein
MVEQAVCEVDMVVNGTDEDHHDDTELLRTQRGTRDKDMNLVPRDQVQDRFTPTRYGTVLETSPEGLVVSVQWEDGTTDKRQRHTLNLAVRASEYDGPS